MMRRTLGNYSRVIMLGYVEGVTRGLALCPQWSGRRMLRRGHLNSAVTGERSKEKSFPGRGTACERC